MGVEVQTPPLLAGDVMDADEFLRRWEAIPDLKRAQLIEGVVHMPSPVFMDHTEPDGATQMCLTLYRAHTPGVRYLPNQSCQLNARTVLQPDTALGLPESLGGNLRYDDRGLVLSAPELTVEVVSSRPRTEFLTRMGLFLRFGGRECVGVFPRQSRVEWYEQVGGTPTLRAEPADGVYRSSVFPGLWLNAAAAATGDVTRVFTTAWAGLASPEHAAFVALLASRAAAQGGQP